MIFKQLLKQSPVYLNRMFVRNCESSRYPENLRVDIFSHTEFDAHAFQYSAIKFWNTIPADMTNSG